MDSGPDLIRTGQMEAGEMMKKQFVLTAAVGAAVFSAGFWAGAAWNSGRPAGEEAKAGDSRDAGTPGGAVH